MANGSKTEWVDPKGKTLKQSKYKSKKEVKKILKDKGLESHEIPRIINFIDKLKISDNVKVSI